MSQLWSFLPSILLLGTVLMVAVVLTMVRLRLNPKVRSRRFALIVGATILVQGLHFIEELQSGFSTRFPEVFGLPPFTERLFVALNVTWLVIWVLALLAVRAGFVIAVCPLWFLGLAMVLNLVAHPMLALRAGEYFPGLLTAPLVGLLGVLTLRELTKVTAPDVRA